MPNLLTTAAAVNARVDQPETTDADMLEDIVAAVTEQIESYLGRKLFRVADFVEYPRQDGKVLQLNRYPVESVSSVLWDDTRVFGASAFEYTENTDYVVHPDRGILELTYGVWPRGSRVLQVTYTGGYVAPGTAPTGDQVAMPLEIVEAAISQTAYKYRTRKEEGLAQITTMEGKLISADNGSLTKVVKDLLSPHLDTRRVLY